MQEKQFLSNREAEDRKGETAEEVKRFVKGLEESFHNRGNDIVVSNGRS